MKKLFAVLFALTTAAAFAGSSGITLTAPVLTSVNGIPVAANSTANTNIQSVFSQLQATLNTDYFSKLHDLNNLSTGFANANSASFDNASLLSFQTYDAFALMLGTNLAVALPSLSPSALSSALGQIGTTGDPYVGMATGGFAGQLGINASFLLKNLYLSVKAGFVPTINTTVSGDNGDSQVTFQQGMFGVGANYTIYPQADFFYGFVKWRGLSFGTGLVYNANTTTMTVPFAEQKQTGTVDLSSVGGSSSTPVTATASNIQAKLTVNDSSVVVPLEVMTSLQALWFLNLGLGAGLDIVFPSSQVKLSGDSALGLTGITGAQFSPGSAVVTATDSKGNGDMFVPRLAASLGFNVTIVKIEVPVSYYPTTKALAFGISAGLVW